MNKVAHVVVSPGDEVEVVVVHEVGRIEDSQWGGRDAPAHRRARDRRVAHGVQDLKSKKAHTHKKRDSRPDVVGWPCRNRKRCVIRRKLPLSVPFPVSSES